jgi:glycine C-acetyltransferase/8-amino-7-oxononanoate synthase
MSLGLEDYLGQALEDLAQKGLIRSLKSLDGIPRPTAYWQGQEVIFLSSNSYLGLHSHPNVIKSAQEALIHYGTGTGASRLISGNLALHEKLERELARFKRYPAAILFSAGYLANLGLITSLIRGPEDSIISDQLNHASIIDACRLSGANRIIYRHKDLDQLRQILNQSRGYGRRWIVTEGIFSMDGDLAPLPGICELAEEYGALVLVDDAHGFGVLGKDGRGTVEHFALENMKPIQIGTLSKALGNLGGYVVGPEKLVDYLRNRARSFIYSTALPPSILAGSLAALRLVENQPQLREKLWARVNYFRRELLALGFNLMDSEAHIIPILVGDLEKTMAFAQGLLDCGIYTPAIRPPTVPEGKCRLRISLMATHTFAQLEKALQALKNVGQRLNII